MKRLLAFLLATMLPVRAQGPVGTFNGTVLDPDGFGVPGASLVATNIATGEEHKTTSTSAGAYTLPYVPSGTYKIRVTAPGFRTSEADNVILHVAQTLTVNMTLEIGEITEQITVSDKPPLLEAGTAEIGRYVSVQEYKSWPIIVDDGQRQIQSFIFSSLPGTTGGTFQGTINGGQQYSHEILIEGIPVGRADLSGGNNNEFSPSVEAIGEFKLQTGAISAQYNGGQTAVANFNIKTGTNDLHGSAYLYIQNEALNALSLETKTLGGHNQKFREDNWGYSIGGPVYIPKVYRGRNRTFWFTNFEKTHIDSLVLGGFATLPTLDFKKGDFSRLFDPSFTRNPLSGTQVGADALGRPIVFGQIYDPLSTRKGPDGEPIRDPFPGNIIPESRWDPVAKNIIQNVGIVDPTFDTMIRNIQRIDGVPSFDLHIFGIKMDHNISWKHHLSGFYNQSYRQRQFGQFLPVPGPPTSVFQEQTTPGHMVRLSLNSTLTPSVLNRVAAGYNRFLNENGAPPSVVNKNWASKIGLQNLPGTVFPVMNFSGNEYQGGTISRFGVAFRDTSPNGSYIYQDDLTWIHGKHSFRFGYEYKRYFTNDKSLSDAGIFNFVARSTDLPGYLDATGHAFASFLLGAADSARHRVSILSEAFRQPQHGFYAIDDWKVTPKLTVNAGLRWEIIPPFYETTGRMSEIDLNAPNPRAGNWPGALVFASHGSRFNNTYWKEFGPRLGLAYQVNNKMVVRGGYAMTNTPPINFGVGFTYGFNGTVNVQQGTSPTGFFDDPAIYLHQRFPDLPAALPDTNPWSANNQSFLTTTARDANRPGYVQNWNFTIQYQLPKESVLEVAYVGNKGTRLWGQFAFSELDSLPSKLLSMGDILNDPVNLHPQYTPYAGFDTSLPVAQALRPHPQFFGVQEAFPYNTSSTYNSLQVTATRRLTSGLGFLAAYTFSKAIGYVDSNGFPAYYTATSQDYYNRGLERSVTTFNYPQDFKLTWVYDTPVGKSKRFNLSWANYIVGGWQLAAIHNYRSGDPIELFQAGLNIPPGFAGGIRSDLLTGVPATLGGASANVDVLNGTPYLNPAAFTSPGVTPNGVPLRVGTAPRVLPNIRGPHHMDETFRMTKKFPLYKQKENTFFHLGMTMTNPFNRIGRYIADTFAGDADFGKVFATGGGRTIQLDARIEF